MASLTGNPIKDTYQGLIKISDNGTIDPTTLQQLTDGSGGTLPIQVSQVQTKFQSSVDFTNATVTGLPSGGGGTNFVGTPWTLNTQASQDLVYETLTIPGGTYGVGDVINIQEIEYRDGLNNWGYSSIWISDTAQTLGQAPAGGANNFSLGQWQSSSSRSSVIYDKTLFITSSGTFCMPVQFSYQTSVNGGDPTEVYNINWANDQHFFFQLWNDSTTGSYNVSGVSITQRS